MLEPLAAAPRPPRATPSPNRPPEATLSWSPVVASFPSESTFQRSRSDLQKINWKTRSNLRLLLKRKKTGLLFAVSPSKQNRNPRTPCPRRSGDAAKRGANQRRHGARGTSGCRAARAPLPPRASPPGAGGLATPKRRETEARRAQRKPRARGAEGDTRGSEKGRRARGGASPCFPLLSSHVAPSAPFPQTRLQTPDAATHSAPPARGPGTPRNRGRSGRDGKGRRKMPDPRPSSPQVPSAGGEGDGAPPGVPPQDTSGQFPSAHSEAQTPCRIPLSGEGFVTDMETWGLTEDSVNCQALRNLRRTAKVSMY